MFSASESVVKKHVIFCVFLLFYLFIPFTRKYNTRKLPRKNSFYRNRTRNQNVARPSSKAVHLSQVHCLLCWFTACCVGLRLVVLVYGLLCWFMACCVGLWLAVLVYGLQCWFTACYVGALETSAPPLGNCCVLNTKKRTKLTLLLNQ